ncbi:hypothetical protein BV22DRAFT_1041762, partial [Leucogyrophana mollusca]
MYVHPPNFLLHPASLKRAGIDDIAMHIRLCVAVSGIHRFEYTLAAFFTVEPEIDIAGRSQGPRVQLPGRYLRDVLARSTSEFIPWIFSAYLNVVVLCRSVKHRPSEESYVVTIPGDDSRGADASSDEDSGRAEKHSVCSRLSES